MPPLVCFLPSVPLLPTGGANWGGVGVCWLWCCVGFLAAGVLLPLACFLPSRPPLPVGVSAGLGVVWGCWWLFGCCPFALFLPFAPPLPNGGTGGGVFGVCWFRCCVGLLAVVWPLPLLALGAACGCLLLVLACSFVVLLFPPANRRGHLGRARPSVCCLRAYYLRRPHFCVTVFFICLCLPHFMRPLVPLFATWHWHSCSCRWC